MQPYIQMGAGPAKSTAWAWWSPNGVNLAHEGGSPENELMPDFGKEHPVTVTWNFKEWYESTGETDPIPGNTEGDDWKGGNGVQKFGIQCNRSTSFFEAQDCDLKLYIGFTDVEIYVHDVDKFMEYVAKASELSGTAFPDDLKDKVKQA